MKNGWHGAAVAMAALLMNVFAAKTVCRFGFLAIDAGIAVSWIPYAIGDIEAWRNGGESAWKSAFQGLTVAFAATIAIHAMVAMPGEWEPTLEPHREAISTLFAMSQSAVLMSFIALAAGVFINAAVHFAMRRLDRGFVAFGARAMASTLLAQTTENMAFAMLYSIPVCKWTLAQAAGASILGALLELAVELAILPIIYRVARK